jgi:uncharacterized membrane protein YccF (DUF307 family)
LGLAETVLVLPTRQWIRQIEASMSAAKHLRRPHRSQPPAGAEVCSAPLGKEALMRTILNVIWFVVAGVWLAIGYAVAAVIMFITIIGIPFGVQAVKLAGYALWPFGRTLIPRRDRHKGLSVVANILWFILVGWWLALEHLIVGILLCVTIIGIPLGVGAFKMAGAALVPFGKEVVAIKDLGRVPPDAIAVDPTT